MKVYSETLHVCKKCGITFEEIDSMGSGLDLCQSCWEDQSDRLWWETITESLI